MFFKKKPVTFRFVTSNKSAFAYTKPDKATKFFPKWWKDLAKGQRERDSLDMTHCHGFLDLYKRSIIVPMWSYLTVKVGEIGTEFYEWQYADGKSELQIHAEEQRGSFLPAKEHQHVKLISPWLMECDEEVAVSWQPVAYADIQTKASVLPAVVIPKQMSIVNINMMLPRENEPTVYAFDAGQPLVQLVPLTEREIKIEHLYVSHENFEERQPPVFFSKVARHTKGLKLMNEQSKCPFGGK